MKQWVRCSQDVARLLHEEEGGFGCCPVHATTFTSGGAMKTYYVLERDYHAVPSLPTKIAVGRWLRELLDYTLRRIKD